MTNEAINAALDVNTGETANLTVEWREVPTLLVDSVVGFVTVANIPRITLGQITYAPEGALPRYQPVVTLAAAPEALRFLSQQLANIADQIAESETADVKVSG